MYIHLGGKTVVKTDSILGIFDIDYCSISKRTRSFLRSAEKSGEIVNVTDDLPKSFVVCEAEGARQVYISGISPATLKKRADYISDLKGFE
ncbi:MAG: DUF370 domain-containing protein [Ruminococcaceae bacterium]|jgi:hypothetical protein|nr:DUF370 domain-containing protein [Oscillospiraceae bacterium]